MKRVFAWLAPMLAAIFAWLGDLETVRDLAGICAVASISYGAGMIYRPAGFIVGGIIVLAIVIFSVLKVRK